MNRASELIPIIERNMSQATAHEHGPLFNAISSAVNGYHWHRVETEIFPKWHIRQDDWLGGSIDDGLRTVIVDEILHLDLGCSLLIGTFAENGMALMYVVWSCGAEQGEDGGPSKLGFVELCGIPGFKTIGSGYEGADFWLNRRGYALSFSPKRAAYHAYEARRMAESSPFVNQNIEMVIANKKEHWYLSSHQHPKVGPWSLAEFASLFREYGPQPTEDLEKKPRAGRSNHQPTNAAAKRRRPSRDSL
jgi:hypothetical protein